LQTHLLKQRFQLTSVQSVEITLGGHRLPLRFLKTQARSMISEAVKKNAISRAADSGLSEP
jgi:hypothetical protein